MGDVFDTEAPDEWRDDLWGLIKRTPNLDYLLLTKREKELHKADGLPDNVWLGVSAENQAAWDCRVSALLATPGDGIRFVSVEPLLGPIEFRGLLPDWVIVGGESGGGARPMDPDWVEAIRIECFESGIPFFFKQWGGVNKKANGRLLNGRQWSEFPARERQS